MSALAATRRRPGSCTVLVLVAVVSAAITLALTDMPVASQPENAPTPDSFLLFGL